MHGSKVMIQPLSIMPTRQAQGYAAGITNLKGAVKKHNVAVTAVARELSCFICGMMNGLTEVQIKKA